MNSDWNIKDDEIRVIGSQSPALGPQSRRKHSRLLIILLIILAVCIGVLLLLKQKASLAEKPEEGIFEEVPEVVVAAVDASPKPFGIETDRSFTERLDTVVNDVILAIYIPHNATPSLTLGIPDRSDKGIILAAQAADIRRDNRKILGAFVLKGQPLAWGLSKKGFCAIIDGVVTVGVSENSPLFEEATEKEGYFFRQYPLVDNGRLVENAPKNKTMRKALCSRAGQIFVAVSESDESFHDFTQALVDLGIENAIYLVGSHDSFGWYIDAAGKKTLFGLDVHRISYKNETYIIWK